MTGNKKTIAGVCCAVATPFNADLSIDHDAMAAHCSTLLAEGVAFLAVAGTTGEANSLSLIERKILIENLVRDGIPADRLLPGTGLNSVSETVELTKHAADIGVAGVVMLPPHYYKSPSDAGVIDFFHHVFEQAGAAMPPCILYNIPQMSGVALNLDIVSAIKGHFPDQVVGIKDSSGDVENMRDMRTHIHDFAVFPGADPLMKELLPEGAAGCITATSNLVSKELVSVYRAAQGTGSDEAATHAQSKIVEAREMSNIGPQIATIKAMLSIRYKYPGWSRMRPPLRPIAEALLQTLRDQSSVFVS
ncbi:MAG: dihydrodipicolinate synthase family protein [Pseudomonadota bacterium]